MFKKVSQDRIYKDIVNQILETIFAGDLSPGDKLPSEKQLQEVFGVSRVTVREAIQSLEQHGVIEVRQGSRGGAFIKKIDMDTTLSQVETAFKMTNLSLQEVTDARIAIEETILRRLLPEKIKPKDLARLENSLAEAEARLNDESSSIRVMEYFGFHTAIAEITDNPIIILMYKLIQRLLSQFFEDTESTPPLTQEILVEHKEILQLLKEGKYEEASQAGVKHIQKGRQQMADTFKQQSLFGRN